MSVAEGKASPKGFTVTWFLPATGDEANEALFAVSEDAFALPWPARFGFSDPASEEEGPRIGYRFDDRDAVIPLPGPKFIFADRIAQTREFREGGVTVVVEEDMKDVDGRGCRLVAVDGGPALRQKIAVERETGSIVRFESDVFLGRGDRFRLTLDQTRSQPVGDQVGAGRRLPPCSAKSTRPQNQPTAPAERTFPLRHSRSWRVSRRRCRSWPRERLSSGWLRPSHAAFPSSANEVQASPGSLSNRWERSCLL